MPVWPTWSVCGRQPALVTTREQPTAAFEQCGQLLEDAEAVGRAHAAPAADHHLGLGEGDAGRHVIHVLGHLHGQVGVLERGREGFDAAGPAPLAADGGTA